MLGDGDGFGGCENVGVSLGGATLGVPTIAVELPQAVVMAAIEAQAITTTELRFAGRPKNRTN